MTSGNPSETVKQTEFAKISDTLNQIIDYGEKNMNKVISIKSTLFGDEPMDNRKEDQPYPPGIIGYINDKLNRIYKQHQAIQEALDKINTAI